MIRSRLIPLLLILLALSLPSCLDAKKDSAVAYDPKSDTFRYLTVYYHIKGANPDELAYLAALADNRREILPFDIVPIFSENAYLRINAKKFYTVSLGQPQSKPDAPNESPIDLQAIINKPGHFFLSDQDTLCYYHQIEIPGILADRVIKDANKKLNDILIKAITDEIQRRDHGGPLQSWDHYRHNLLRVPNLDSPPEETPDQQEPEDDQAESQKYNPLSCLDAESLGLLLKAANSNHDLISRTGSTFSLSLQLSDPDRRQLQSLWDNLKTKFADSAGDQEWSKFTIGAMNLVKINPGNEHRLTVSADFIDVQNLVEKTVGPGRFQGEPDTSSLTDYQETVEAMKKHGVAIDPDIKLNEIIERFQNNTLPVDLAGHWYATPFRPPLEVGKGLFTEAPAKQNP